MIKQSSTSRLAVALGIAILFFFLMFSIWTAPKINFWLTMCITGLTLSLYTIFIGWKKDEKQEIKFNLSSILIGIGSAALLWGIFWLGNKVSTSIFSFAGEGISNIHSIKSGNSPILIGFMLVCLIGPAEEIFWRGYVQNNLSKKFGKNLGFVVATALYTLVHIWSFNPMLILAAMVAGGFWGLMYRFFPKNLAPLIISHALWDVSVFILFPVGG